MKEMDEESLFDLLSSFFDPDWEYRSGGPDRSLSDKGRLLSEGDLRDICERALLSDYGDLVRLAAIELIAAKSPVNIADILLLSLRKDSSSTEDIQMLDLLLARSEEFDESVFHRFLAKEKSVLVRQTASRVILLADKLDDTSALLSFLAEETDKVTKVNLAACAYLATGRNDHWQFVRHLTRDSDLDVARAARECLMLVEQ